MARQLQIRFRSVVEDRIQESSPENVADFAEMYRRLDMMRAPRDALGVRSFGPSGDRGR